MDRGVDGMGMYVEDGRFYIDGSMIGLSQLSVSSYMCIHSLPLPPKITPLLLLLQSLSI